MPIINAYPFPSLGRILVQVDWADVEWATCAQVTRTTIATGYTAPLRTYVNPCSTTTDEYQTLSGGQAVFWDTEAPLGTPFYYTTTALDANGAVVTSADPNDAYDIFERSVSNSWGNPNKGPAYNGYFPDTTRFSVASGQGIMTHTAVNDGVAVILPIAVMNIDMYIDMDTVIGTGAGTGIFFVRVRHVASNNSWLEVAIFVNPGGSPVLSPIQYYNLNQVSTGGFFNATNVAPGAPLRIRFQAIGGTAFRFKAYSPTDAEPDAWLAEQPMIGSLSFSGDLSIGSTIPAGWTNTPPFNTTWDNIYINDLDVAAPAITASTCPSALNLHGVTGNYAVTPDTAALDITGDIDVRADVTMPNWFIPGNQRVFITKWTSITQRSYVFDVVDNGILRLFWTTDGINALFASSTVAVTPTSSGRLAVRATLDVDNGAAGRTVTFYTAPTIAGPWTQLGAPVVQGGTTSIFSGTAVVEVGSYDVGINGLWPGMIYAVQVLNGINGPVVAYPNFATQPPGTRVFTDVTGLTWSLQGTLSEIIAPCSLDGSITFDSTGCFWLRDPVRPCNDQQLCSCTSGTVCNPASCNCFLEMRPDQYEPNVALPISTNARRPIPVSRRRRDTKSAFAVATRLFTDRDAMLNLLEPGAPLFLEGPPQYGIPDQYMTVNTVQVARTLSDHRRQTRLLDFPFTAVDRPVGVTEGICPAQFQNQCTVYGTWDAMAAANVTWTDLILGIGGGVVTGFRDWIDVENGFANWLAVENHGTWGQLKTGA